MAVKKYKPYTPARRFMIGYDFSEITKFSPEKSLVSSVKRTGGRNNQGKVTSRSMGGGHKRLFRTVDFRAYDKA
jgi:large subunit ribosomal protein L2